jgi:hypothetical protein
LLCFKCELFEVHFSKLIAAVPSIASPRSKFGNYFRIGTDLCV